MTDHDYRNFVATPTGKLHIPDPLIFNRPRCGMSAKSFATYGYTATEFAEMQRRRGTCFNCLDIVGGMSYTATERVTTLTWRDEE